jgi:hypothetical protein
VQQEGDQERKTEQPGSIRANQQEEQQHQQHQQYSQKDAQKDAQWESIYTNPSELVPGRNPGPIMAWVQARCPPSLSSSQAPLATKHGMGAGKMPACARLVQTV